MCRGLSVAVRSLLMASRRDVYVGTYIVCQKHEILPASQVSWSPRCRSYLQSSTPLHDAWRGPHCFRHYLRSSFSVSLLAGYIYMEDNILSSLDLTEIGANNLLRSLITFAYYVGYAVGVCFLLLGAPGLIFLCCSSPVLLGRPSPPAASHA